MSCFWRLKILCFTSLTNLNLGSEKNRWKWKTLKWLTWQYALFLLFVKAKNWPPGAEAIFLPKHFILKYFQKLMPNYFWTKKYSWAKFKGNWFSDVKRSGPVLGRLSLNVHCKNPILKENNIERARSFRYWHPGPSKFLCHEIAWAEFVKSCVVYCKGTFIFWNSVLLFVAWTFCTMGILHSAVVCNLNAEALK